VRILLIHPQARVHRRETGIYGRSLRYAPLTMPLLATLVPPDLRADIRIIDEMADKVDFDAPVDLVGLTCITGTSHRCYEIADRFRARGIAVVIGGVHATTLPEEAAGHADAVVTGYAEETWPMLLRDFAAGRLKARYASSVPPADYIRPDRRYIRRAAYMQPDTVELLRGCGHKCEYCASRSLYPGLVARSADDALEEIAGLPGKTIGFLDPNLMTDLPLAYEFFGKLAALRKWWLGCATVEIKDHPDLLDLMAKSGCKGLLIGFESVRQSAVDSAGKTFNRVSEFGDVVRLLHRKGIIVEGCFVLGFDDDDRAVFKETADLVTRTGMDYVHYTLYTPFPGTKAYERLEGEGRILTRDWSRYNGRHVVFRPHRMTPGELTDGFRYLWEKTYALPAILRRLAGPPWATKPLVFFSNLQSRYFQKRAACLEP
jgi:radical SAM superfamily enzyme YgiQ (UPF0313 family)